MNHRKNNEERAEDEADAGREGEGGRAAGEAAGRAETCKTGAGRARVQDGE